MNEPFLFVTPAFGRAHGMGGVAVSAERIAGHLGTLAPVCVVTSAVEIPPGVHLVQAAEADGAARVVCRYGRPHDADEHLQLVGDLVHDIIREQRPRALVSFYASELAFPVALAAAFHGLPHICCVRGNDIDLQPYGPHGFHVHHALSRAALIVCVSREAERKVRALVPGAPTAVIANGIDAQSFDRPPRRPGRGQTLTVGLFGDVKQKKGLDTLLAALDFGTCRLKIVGELREGTGKLLHGFECLRPEVAFRVEQTPYTADLGQLLSHYEACDIVAIPSHHEGLPNVLLEAMALRRVVVGAAVGGLPDVLRDGENGFLFTARSPASLRHALERAASAAADPEHRIAAAARATVEQGFTEAMERAEYRRVFSRHQAQV